MKKITVYLLIITLICMMGIPVFAGLSNPTIGINVLLNQEVTKDILSDLQSHGKVQNIIYEINAVTMKIKSDELINIRSLPFVVSANPDAARNGAPIDTISAENMLDGAGTWNLDAINVTEPGFNNRQVDYDGSGVYIAVLDTGLLDSWRQYFPEERIAEEYAISFGGGGGETGTVSTQPNKWQHDQNSHGTHVTSTILGYSMYGNPVNGVAPMATIIPVKVLNQNGSGWSSVIAAGITYVADLKAGPLADYPVIINMSLGGPSLDALEQAAIDYAISKGVIIVASAGNEGEAGMGYPGAYEPVISVAASGWTGEWVSGSSWWNAADVTDPTDVTEFYITDFSSREHEGQDLDVAAPGSWIVGPYQVNSGQISYYFLGGTSMASPHVAGIVALMAEKQPAMTAAEAEAYLEDSAIPMDAGTRSILTGPGGVFYDIEWGTDATGAGLVDAAAALDMIP
ncbi:MAG: S8 family serine peptidase [Clostridia bacterium]|nr:S8 family serine peptidase [Clostridia bacterium]